jgi:adenosylcobinamide-GDP ribazoletransferase
MRNLFPFFTRLPLTGDLDRTRNEIWLLPLLGIITAFLPSLILYFDFPVKGLFSVLTLYFIIGLVHIDGLADFADGIMVKGSREDKIRAMKDAAVGIAGVFTLVVILLLQIFTLNILPFWALLVSEINSKMSIPVMLYFKKPLGNGLGSYFMKVMTTGKLFLSIVIYIILISMFFSFYNESVISILSLLMPFCIARISVRNFGGINGDCIGASAELTRALSLVILVLSRIS